MTDLEPRTPQRPLLWPDSLLDISEMLKDETIPVYIVGGAVRDAYLQRPVKDLDLVTPYNSIGVGRKIANTFDGAFYVLDAEREVARALVDVAGGRLIIDIARFRGQDLAADLTARDFTLNAMAVDLRSDLTQIIDPLNGEEDLRNRIVRRCAPDALRDDPIRALRAVRQSIQFSARIAPETLADMRTVAPDLAETSPERIRDELFRLLSSKAPSRALRVADALQLLDATLPQIVALKARPYTQTLGVNDAWVHTLAVVEKMRAILETIGPKRTEQTAALFGLGMIVMSLDPFRPQLQLHILHEWPNERLHAALLMLAVLLHEYEVDQRSKKVEATIAGLRLSNDEKQRLALTLQGFVQVGALDVQSAVSMHRFWRAYGQAGVDACLLAMADHLGTRGVALNQNEWVLFLERIQTLLAAYYTRYDQIVAPPVLVDGDALISALDLRPGRQIGQLLDAIREAQVEGRVTSAEEALKFAAARLRDD